MKPRKKRIMIVVVGCCLPLLLGCQAMDARVFQGSCISYDAEGGELVLNNDEPELNAVDNNAAQVSFDTASARVGLTPSPGDRIRVSYRMEGERFVASKVMNVTRQDLMEK